MHEVNVEKIQTETLKIIKETNQLLQDLMEVTPSETGEQKRALSKENLEAHSKALNNETKKLKNLEFVIAVVGTMKAGKSTTINAIVGQEILPNRSFPMTALPTLVTHKLGQDKPELTLPKRAPLTKLFDEVRSRVSGSVQEGAFLGSKDGGELQELLQAGRFEFQERYQGQEEIFSFLKTLNDLMRAAKELGIQPPYSEFRDVDELPRIEVEFFYLKQMGSISEARLTILDTPGPDEFKHSVELQKIFQTQLGQASAVMLVMNYTAMNNKSDGEVRGQVKEITGLIGEEHMYVLVNKFDEKGKNDPDRDETKHHIAKDLLDGKIDVDNVFPVSSKIAFYVNQGRQELDRKGSIDIDLPWVSEFGEEIIGRRWEKLIDDVNEVEECCSHAWEDSFFQEPLDKVIVHAHAKSASKSIDSALNRLSEVNKRLNNSFSLHETSLKKNVADLKQSIVDLNDDIGKMSQVSDKVSKDVKTSLGHIKKDIDASTQQELEDSRKNIINILDRKLSKNKEEIEAGGRVEKENRNKNLSGVELMLKGFFGGGFGGGNESGIDQDVKEQIAELQEKGEVRFSSKTEAKDFSGAIQDILSESIGMVLERSEIMFKDKVEIFIPDVNANIQHSLGSLLDEIKKRMGGDIDIAIPEVIFTKKGVSIKGEFNDVAQSRTVTKTRSVARQSAGGSVKRFFGGLFGQDDWGYDEESYNVTTHTIKKSEIERKISAAFDRVSKNIKANAEDLYTKKIQEVVSNSIKSLASEIEDYRGEMIGIIKTREVEGVNIEKEIKSAKKNQAASGKIKERVEVSKGQLESLEA